MIGGLYEKYQPLLTVKQVNETFFLRNKETENK